MNDMSGKQGFTLIEVVVTIIIAALAGIVIFAYLGNVLTRSHESIGQVRDLAEAVKDMEEIAARYSDYLDPSVDVPGFNCAWLLGNLPVESTDCTDVTGILGTDFATFRITITKNDQTVVALFTE